MHIYGKMIKKLRIQNETQFSLKLRQSATKVLDTFLLPLPPLFNVEVGFEFNFVSPFCHADKRATLKRGERGEGEKVSSILSRIVWVFRKTECLFVFLLLTLYFTLKGWFFYLIFTYCYELYYERFLQAYYGELYKP